MLVTSRSLAEYRAMFDLDDIVLTGRVLDCCAGASSFVAEVADLNAGGDGGWATAVDPSYGWPRSDLLDAVTVGLDSGTKIIADNDDRFRWDWYGSPHRRDEMRRRAAHRFRRDFDERHHAYVAAQLPYLPFAASSFDLVLCSHLLFTWSDVFDVDWHAAAMFEMLRVARGEVRVFPLVVQGSGDLVHFLSELLERLTLDGRHVQLREVPYEFQRGANKMLVASKR